MRTKLYLAALAALAAAPACSWTEFDDLEGDTWVTATDKPNGDSSDYGVALARGRRTSTDRTFLVVMGNGQPQYTELEYSANGDVDLAPTAQKLNSQFGVGNLDVQPILIADPTTDDVSLVVNSGSTSIAVLTGTGRLDVRQVHGPMKPDAATYMLPPPLPPNNLNPKVQVLVAQEDAVFGAFVENTPNPQPKCNLLDDAATAIDVKGLGAVRFSGSTSDDVLVWGVPKGSGTGKLLVYPGSVFNGCGNMPAVPQAPITGWTPTTTTLAPSNGSQLIMIDAMHVLVVGHKDAGNTDSFLGVFRIDGNAKTITMVGTPVTLPDLRTAAIYEEAGKRFVVAGYPTSLVDGVKSGHVSIYKLDLTSGLGAAPEATLRDAQPEEDQVFGRAIAVVPFNGRSVIAVGASNEVFMYFRTALYDETRSGR